MEFLTVRIPCRRVSSAKTCFNTKKHSLTRDVSAKFCIDIFSRRTYIICKKRHVKDSKILMEYQKIKLLTLIFEFSINVVTIWHLIYLVTKFIPR